MNNQKLVVKLADLAPEDTIGYRGIFFTDASAEEIRCSSRAYFLYSSNDPDDGKLVLRECNELGKGTTLRILANKPKFEELTDLVSQGFVTRVDCLGAGEKLNYIEDVVRNLLSQGRKVVLLPFTKNKIDPETVLFINGC